GSGGRGSLFQQLSSMASTLEPFSSDSGVASITDGLGTGGGDGTSGPLWAAAAAGTATPLIAGAHGHPHQLHMVNQPLDPGANFSGASTLPPACPALPEVGVTAAAAAPAAATGVIVDASVTGVDVAGQDSSSLA